MSLKVAVPALAILASSYGCSLANSAQILTDQEMDKVIAGAISFAGTYYGTIMGEDTGNLKITVKKSGVVNGRVNFENGGEVKIRGSAGEDGSFGAVLLGKRKEWGIGSLWGKIRPDFIRGWWSRPNNLDGTFTGRP